MDKIFTSIDYCVWLEDQVAAKRPYWYGTTFQPCTQAQLDRKARQYPDHYTANRMYRYEADIRNEQICGDCVGGAIKGAAWTDLGQHKVIYASNGVPDRSADGMFKYCKSIGAEYGNISTIPDRPGIAVRMAGHVGVYVGNGYVVEWRGFKYGCVKTQLEGRGWTDWYELPWVNYGEAEIEPNNDVKAILGRRLLKVGRKGDDVALLQELLNEQGFDAGVVDGEYGKNTRDAVKRLQEAAGIDVDGQFGEESLKALMSLLAEKNVEDNVTTDAEKRVVVVTASHAANIRAGAGTNYPILTVAKCGTKLPYVSVADNGWFAVQLDGQIGWISNKMAELGE